MIKRKRFNSATNEEINYIRNRYSDSESDSESLKRIYYHIENKPKCPICGNSLRFIGMPSCMFPKFCSPKCAQTSKETRNKIKETCLKKYGVINGGGSKQALEKIKQTCQEKYGVDSVFSIESVREKIRETNIKKYGVSIPSKSVEIKNKLKEILNTQEIKDKIYKTKKKNNSFNKSLEEKISLIYLSLSYPDVKQQIKYSKSKNYISDFYIPCLDLYIECDYHWTHGGHKFNPNDKKDINKIKIWESKCTKYYNNAVNCWTKKDVEKDEFIHKNGYKCLHFYNLQELIDWLQY